MISLARKSLVRELHRYIPAILAICFAGVLLFVQAALVLGIFGSAAVYVTSSSANLWIGYPGTQSVNLGRGINNDIEMLLLMNKNISAVEPLIWVDSDWRSSNTRGGVSVFTIGINPHNNGIIFDKVLPAHLRPLLMEPGAVIIDRADLDQLGVRSGDFAWIDGKHVHVVATANNLRALGGVNVLCSLETARTLASSRDIGKVTYWVAKLKNVSAASATINELIGKSSFGNFEVWTDNQFALRSQFYWMLDTGAGVAVLFMAAIVMLVGIVVASQALMSVVISAAREYATLNALGVGMAALRRVILEQSAWIGSIGLILSAAVSAVLLTFAKSRDVPVDVTPIMTLVWAAVVLGIALLSGLIAMRGLLRADPSSLLR